MGPDFVIVGVPAPDGGVYVYASDHLWEAHFSMESDPIYMQDGYLRRVVDPGPRTFTITTTGGNLLIAKGRDYAEAVSALFRDWQPEHRERKGLPAATPELEAGR